MKNIWMLTMANLRKNKSQTIGLLAFVVIASMFLYIGLTMYLDVGKFFDKRAEQLNVPNLSFIINSEERIHYVYEYPGITEIETQNILIGYGSYFTNKDNFINGINGVLIFARADENQNMNPPSLIGKSLPLSNDAIYIPHFMMSDGGYMLGENIMFDFSGTELTFTLGGSTEEILFGSYSNTLWRVYVSNETFNELSERFPANRQNIVSIQMENPGDVWELNWQLANEFPETENDSIFERYTRGYNSAKNAMIQIPQIAAMVMTVFAIILLIISLIVIRFRIINDIEEKMKNIGVLKASGFRNAQIILSIIMQFGIIALTGGIMGIIVSQFVLPFATKLIEPQLGLVWNPALNIIYALITLSIILFMVSFTSFVSSWRINKLHPLMALRGGISTHSFSKNSVPLDNSNIPLILSLSLKQLLRNKKQSIMISLIITALMFASVAGIAIHYNMNVNNDAYIRLMGGEISDVFFELNDDVDSEAFFVRLLERNEVRKAYGFHTQYDSVICDERFRTAITIAEDFSLLEGSTLISGRYPKHDNEVALGAVIINMLGKKIDDTIVLKGNEIEKVYIITGIIQTTNNGGRHSFITMEGFYEIQPDFMLNQFNVYLIDGVDHQYFLDSIKREEGDIFVKAYLVYDSFSGQIESIGNIFAAVAASMVSVTALVVILVLYLVIKTIILRRNRELGIQKALGFTTFQLMNQIALNMSPIILIGVLLGAVGGYFGFNLIFVAMTRSMGIVSANLPIPLSWTFVVCVTLTVLAYVVSMLIAWRIRKISAYSLVSE